MAHQSLIKISLIFVIIVIAFAIIIIKNFLIPLDGAADIFHWEYVGYYLANNLKFTPLPQLDLINNQGFYPYGTNNVFHPWGIERDIFYAIFYSLFGFAGWIQIYYLISVIITAIGTFLLLHKDYGLTKASGIAILITFANFYAVKFYPIQMSYSVLHWTILGIITDFLIVKRVVQKQTIYLRFILLKVCLLILALSQELGYIAGYALTSFTISLAFIALLNIYRIFKKEWSLNNLINTYKQEIVHYPRQLILLIGLCVLVGSIYIPLVFQIAKEAKSFNFTEVYSNGPWWGNPLRLFIPYLPGLDLVKIPMETYLKDQTVSDQVDVRPGIFLLILGVLGLWQSRKQITIYIPLLLLFFLCLLYHPKIFPVLQLFPWFAFNRVASRSTVIYPVIFGLFALGINFKQLFGSWTKLAATLLVLLACIEFYTAYSLPTFDRDYPTYFFKNKNEFFAYMNQVKQQPGEAVLDWPFCITGGNGIGSVNNLCPYFGQNSGVFTLKRFHEKKVVGEYFGRLHPSQIEPFVEAGWYKLFSPTEEGDSFTKRQSRCFYENEWSFFTDFFKYNDFAGINLYVNLLPENCVAEFHRRFGSPIAQTEVPAAGKVQFIPKSPELTKQVNPSLGLSLKYNQLSELDLIRNSVADRLITKQHNISLKGISSLEKDSSKIPIDLGSRWRWGSEQQTIITFNLFEPQALKLTFELVSPIKEQNINIQINEVSVEEIKNLELGNKIQKTVQFQGIQGINTISFQYTKATENAIAFTKLKISSR